MDALPWAVLLRLRLVGVNLLEVGLWGGGGSEQGDHGDIGRSVTGPTEGVLKEQVRKSDEMVGDFVVVWAVDDQEYKCLGTMCDNIYCAYSGYYCGVV